LHGPEIGPLKSQSPENAGEKQPEVYKICLKRTWNTQVLCRLEKKKKMIPALEEWDSDEARRMAKNLPRLESLRKKCKEGQKYLQSGRGCPKGVPRHQDLRYRGEEKEKEI